MSKSSNHFSFIGLAPLAALFWPTASYAVSFPFAPFVCTAAPGAAAASTFRVQFRALEGGLGAQLSDGSGALSRLKDVDLGKLSVAQVLPPSIPNPPTPDKRVAIYMRSNDIQAGRDKIVYDELVVINGDENYPKSISPHLRINDIDMRFSCRIEQPQRDSGIPK